MRCVGIAYPLDSAVGWRSESHARPNNSTRALPTESCVHISLFTRQPLTTCLADIDYRCCTATAAALSSTALSVYTAVTPRDYLHSHCPLVAVRCVPSLLSANLHSEFKIDPSRQIAANARQRPNRSPSRTGARGLAHYCKPS